MAKRRVNVWCLTPVNSSVTEEKTAKYNVEVFFAMHGINAIALSETSKEEEYDYQIRQSLAEGKTPAEACDVVIALDEDKVYGKNVYSFNDKNRMEECVEYCRKCLA